jgi:hypothetical protein
MNRLLCLVLWIAVPTVASGQTNVEAVVAAFSPVERLQIGPDEASGGCYVVLATDAQGQPATIAAMYQSLSVGILRVLGRNGAGDFEAQAESAADVAFFGVRCSLTTRDLDGDGSAELVLVTSEQRNEAAWVFRWSNGTLLNATPMMASNGRWMSRLGSPVFADADHAGTGSVFASSPPSRRSEDVGQRGYLFRWSGGDASEDPAVVDLWYGRYQGVPLSRHRARSDGGPGAYVLRVVNGEAGGVGRVSSVEIKINDVVVAGAQGLTAGTEFMELSLPGVVAPGSIVEVTTEGGGPEGTLLLMLERRSS